MADEGVDQSESMTMRVTRRVLRPLVRLFTSQGISFTQLIELLKEIYVKEVARDLERAGERCTYSRISVISGVHRKDVKRLMEIEEGIPPASRKISVSARLFSIWSGTPEYLDAEGRPRPLPRLGTDESEPSFETLVSSVISDVRPRAILDEWLSRGIVSIDESEMVRLNEEAIYPNKTIEDKLHHFGRNVADHISACDYNLNLEEDGKSLPERAVFFGGLSQESVDQLQKSATKWLQKSLLAINAEALELAKRDDEKEAAEERFTFGAYFYRERKGNNGNQ